MASIGNRLLRGAIMYWAKGKVCLSSLTLFLFVICASPVYSQSPPSEIQALQKQLQSLQSQMAEVQAQLNRLSARNNNNEAQTGTSQAAQPSS
ncbi:MAG TPA: hypothetical protein VG498_07230, partial [Terriglobales bacterium]|nr:hypothetical protein [Terriglobales bacterium]